jgi:MTH538 TIR-like domain (DUF1863)
MAGFIGIPSNSNLYNLLAQPVRRKIFVSYHHGGDQNYYNSFSSFFHDAYDAVFDNSIERKIDSDDVRYVMQRIRDKHITGTSCTIVLIGAQTHERKYVDWEIKATLEKQHGLVGIVLPNHQKTFDDKIIVPDRFYDNIVSGFASWEHWSNLTVQRLKELVNAAALKPASLINNSQSIKQRNGS